MDVTGDNNGGIRLDKGNHLSYICAKKGGLRIAQGCVLGIMTKRAKRFYLCF